MAIYLSIYIADRKIQAHDFVADQQFHASVVLQKCDQFTLYNEKKSFQHISRKLLKSYNLRLDRFYS